MNGTRLLWAILVLAGLLPACASGRQDMKPLRVVEHVDLDRYLGTWFEIARYPNRFQKGCVEAMAQYRLRPDGKIRVLNTCRDAEDPERIRSAEGRAWVVDQSSGAKLRVSFFWPFSGDYWIIDLGEHYEYAVVGHPKRSYLWILARRPTMDESLFRAIATRLAEQEYDPRKLIIGRGALIRSEATASQAPPPEPPAPTQHTEK